MRTLALVLALLGCTTGNPAYLADVDEMDAEPDAGADDAFYWAPAYIDVEFPDAALPDRDLDGVPDDVDNCPDVPNSDQSNIDGDDNGGDKCDVCPAWMGTPESHADADDDGFAPCHADCDDHDQAVYHAFNGIGRREEVCDGKDNDCNGRVDDAEECEVDADE